MRLVWCVGGGQTGHGGEAHLALEDHTTSNEIYCPSHDPAPKIRWVCGGGRIVPDEQVVAGVVAGLEAGCH